MLRAKTEHTAQFGADGHLAQHAVVPRESLDYKAAARTQTRYLSLGPYIGQGGQQIYRPCVALHEEFA